MRSAHELLCLAEDFDALASTASNPLAKAQWRTCFSRLCRLYVFEVHVGPWIGRLLSIVP
jgi:hypothetical protein